MRRFVSAALLSGLLLVLAACNQQPNTRDPQDPVAPSRVWFVSNAAPGPAFTGDLEAPFASLAAAEAASGPGDTIFLFSGDGSSRGQDQGVTLKEGQRLIGEGVGLASAGIAAGGAPVVTNLNGAAIDLAADNAVHGLRIETPQAAGISGIGVETLSLEAVTIEGAGGDGVRIEAAAGGSMMVVATGLAVTGSARAGLRLVARGASGMQLELGSSSFTANRGNAVQLDYLGSNGGHFDIGDVAISTLGASGIRVVSDGPASQLVEGRIAGAVVTSSDPGTAGNGIAVIVEGDATALIEVLDNTVTRFGSYGLDLGSRGGSGVLEVTVAGNSVADPARYALAGMRLVSGNGAVNESNVLCLNLSENHSTEGSVPGYLHRQRPGTRYQLHGFRGPGASPTAVAGFLAARNAGSVTLAGADAGQGSAVTSASCRRPGF